MHLPSLNMSTIPFFKYIPALFKRAVIMAEVFSSFTEPVNGQDVQRFQQADGEPVGKCIATRQ